MEITGAFGRFFNARNFHKILLNRAGNPIIDLPNRLETVSTRFEQFWSLPQILKLEILTKFHQIGVVKLKVILKTNFNTLRSTAGEFRVVLEPPATF